jgi:phosphoenolpyruvate carboxykinase (ATP)
MVNTGWTGGPFGVGKRISIQYTRQLLSAALSGKLQSVKFRKDPVFGFDVPESCEGIPATILDPAKSWPSRTDYAEKCKALAARFIENFQRMSEGCPQEVINAGPKIANVETA